MDGKFTFVDHRVINLMGYTPVNIDHHHYYSDDHSHSLLINLLGLEHDDLFLRIIATIILC